jgi:hypothetical protein
MFGGTQHNTWQLDICNRLTRCGASNRLPAAGTAAPQLGYQVLCLLY